jgi:endogenous inhibitor of DNA gyrase (YacG/DUF329 family)
MRLRAPAFSLAAYFNRRVNLVRWTPMPTNCPNCQRRLPWGEIFAFADLFGRRKIVPCPSCNVLLRWSAFWYRVGLTALWCNILIIFPIEYGQLPRRSGLVLWAASLAVFIPSAFLRRLETAPASIATEH